MSNHDKIQRSILPIPDRQHVGLTTYDAKDPDTKFPPIEPLRPPKGAPNVLIVLLDDVGFAASSAFGGPCQTPNFAKLAVSGLKYNRFHTTALCSPTRQALLTGRNHHSVNMGGICEIATSAPGYTSVLPKSKAPLPMTLKLNGYSTAQFGKCHEVPVWETSRQTSAQQMQTRQQTGNAASQASRQNTTKDLQARQQAGDAANREDWQQYGKEKQESRQDYGNNAREDWQE